MASDARAAKRRSERSQPNKPKRSGKAQGTPSKPPDPPPPEPTPPDGEATEELSVQVVLQKDPEGNMSVAGIMRNGVRESEIQFWLEEGVRFFRRVRGLG